MRPKKKAVTTLYCAVSPQELEAIKCLRWKSFPARDKEEAGFYPVLNRPFALQKARDWTLPAWGEGYITCFRIAALYVRNFEVQTLSGEVHEELWVPAEELDTFNKNIVGKIQLLQALLPEAS